MEKVSIGDAVQIMSAEIPKIVGHEGIVILMYHDLLKTQCLILFNSPHVGWKMEDFRDDVPADLKHKFSASDPYSFWWCDVNDLKIIATKEEKENANTHDREGENNGDADGEYHDVHYNSCAIEPIRAMQSLLTPEQFTGFLLGNVLKYRLRAGHKGDAKKDIEKALRYEQWLKEGFIKGH